MKSVLVLDFFGQQGILKNTEVRCQIPQKYFFVRTMKRFLIICLFFALAVLLSGNFGCNVNPRPEVSAASYGKVVDQLPDIPEAKQRYNYPDYVELRHIPK